MEEVTDPYLNVFRRFIPPLGGGGFALDLSPILGDHPALIAQELVVGADPRVSSAKPRPRADAWWRALAICGAVVLVDQVTKAIVVSSLSVGHSERLALGFKLTQHPELRAGVRDRQRTGVRCSR